MSHGVKNTNHYENYINSESVTINSINEDCCKLFLEPKLLYFLTFISTLGGFLFGYDTGIVSGAVLLLEKPQAFHLTLQQIELVVSIAIIGAIIGAILAGFCTTKYGRKNSIIVSSFLFVIGSLFMAIAESYGILLFGRLLVGFGIGLSSMCVPLYIAEVAPSDSRGVLMTLNTVCCTFGQVIAALVAGVFSNTNDGWRHMLGLGGIPALIQLLGMYKLPESPRWLLQKGRDLEAKHVLCKIRQSENIECEYLAIQQNITSELVKSNNKTCFSFEQCKSMLNKKVVLRALAIGCALQALQQFSGINTVMYYGATIIRYAGFTKDSDAIWLSALVALSNFLFTFVGIYCVDRYGRRKLTLWSLGMLTLFLSLLGGVFYLREYNSTHVDGYGTSCSAITTCIDCLTTPTCSTLKDLQAGGYVCFENNMMSDISRYESVSTCPKTSPTWMNWLIVAVLFSYLGAYASGMGSTPWSINAEIYPLNLRDTGMGIATCVNWGSNLLISSFFLSMVKSFTSYGTFFIFTAIGIIGWIYLYNALPETAGKTLEEIQSLFSSSETRNINIKKRIDSQVS